LHITASCGKQMGVVLRVALPQEVNKEGDGKHGKYPVTVTVWRRRASFLAGDRNKITVIVIVTVTVRRHCT
jgi:hypothetical protein